MYGCCGHIECVEVHAKEVGCIPITSSRCLDLPISVLADAINEDIKVRCRVVCSSNHPSAYLQVSTDTLWLTPDMLSEEFDIYSNVSWRID